MRWEKGLNSVVGETKACKSRSRWLCVILSDRKNKGQHRGVRWQPDGGGRNRYWASQDLSMHAQYSVPRRYCLNSPHCFQLYSSLLSNTTTAGLRLFLLKAFTAHRGETSDAFNFTGLSTYLRHGESNRFLNPIQKFGTVPSLLLPL